MPTRVLPETVRRLLAPTLALLLLAACSGADGAYRVEGAAGDVAGATASSQGPHEHDGHDGHERHGALHDDADDDDDDHGGRDAGSLHDLDIRWHDQDGKVRTIADLNDGPLVVAMIYTTCVHTCPLIIADLKQLEAALTQEQRAGVRFVLVSMDPERDTVEQLATFARDARLDTARWTLLTGSSADVRMTAAALGIRYRAGASGDIDHSNAITILDAEGEVAYKQRGVGNGTDAARQALIRLLP